ncbi:MAG: nicotinamide mononucleotide transporter [Clostridia bacterium]|nr:nicotinamide mononucleotide transporter [Clostridia bacterium]
MNLFKSLKALSRFELLLWILSLITVSISFLALKDPDYLTLVASLTGVTALIFVAKGYVLGQVLTVIFALFYGIISFKFKYYGEMITYLLMTAPMAVMAIISWVRHPFKNSNEVEVNRLSKRSFILGITLSLIVTMVFFFVLRALGNANLFTSTISVTTSFLASYLTFVRSPYYALAYGANDIVLIVLWIMASVTTPSYLPMVFCFIMFLVNDLYGFYNWNKMLKKQSKFNFCG